MLINPIIVKSETFFQVVLQDSPSLTPDLIQKIAYQLTHMYYNWPGNIILLSFLLAIFLLVI
jgi:hypothetical protein